MHVRMISTQKRACRQPDGTDEKSLVDLRKILNDSEPKVKRVQVVRGVEKLEFKHTSWSI